MHRYTGFVGLLVALLAISSLAAFSAPLAAQDDVIIIDHEDVVWDVTFSPDGSILASCDEQGMVMLWDVATGAAEVFEAHEKPVLSLAFSPDGSMLATGSKDDTVVLWDLATGEALHVLEMKDNVNSVAFNSDGSMLAAGSKDEKVWLWDTETGNLLIKLGGHKDAVNAVAFSPDDEFIASAGGTGKIHIWDALTGEELKVLEGHEGAVTDLVFGTLADAEAYFLLSGSDDKTLGVWSLETDDNLLFEVHERGVTALAVNAAMTIIASASGDHTIKLWDFTDVGEPVALAVLEGHTWVVNAVAFSPDGALLASAAGDNTVRVWDLASLDIELPTSAVPSDSVEEVSVDLDTAAETYAANCAACHGADGQGSAAPALVANDALADAGEVGVRAIVTDGVDGTSMPSFGARLSEPEINGLVALLLSWQ